MLLAVESGSGFEDLRDLTQRFFDEGTPSEILLDDPRQIRGLVPEDLEQTVLDVMCKAQRRIERKRAVG